MCSPQASSAGPSVPSAATEGGGGVGASRQVSAPQLPFAYKQQRASTLGERPETVGIYYADSFNELPPSATYDRCNTTSLRPSISAGYLGSANASAPPNDATVNECVNEYLQRLPPVLRRSVTGTGARQHTARSYGRV